MGILSGRGSLSRGITSFRFCGKGFAAFCFACLQHVVQGLQKRGVLHRLTRHVEKANAARRKRRRGTLHFPMPRAASFSTPLGGVF